VTDIFPPVRERGGGKMSPSPPCTAWRWCWRRWRRWRWWCENFEKMRCFSV